MVHYLNPYELAQMIRALDTRLVAIEFKNEEGQRKLIYRYEVAGRIELFDVLLVGNQMDSIAALYPEAQRFEEAIQRCHGIQFQPQRTKTT